MGRKPIFICLTGGLLWLILIAICESVFSGQHIWILGAEHHIDEITAGERVEFKTWLFNPTGQTIDIRPEPTCGCAISNMSTNSLTALNGKLLTIQLDTSGKPEGNHHETIDLVMRSDAGSWRERLVIRYRIIDSKNRRKHHETSFRL